MHQVVMIKRSALLCIVGFFLFSFVIRNGFSQDGLYVQEINMRSSGIVEMVNNYDPKEAENDEWVTLSENELAEKKIELTFKIVGATAELMDSISLPYASKGLSKVIDAGIKVREYGAYLRREHHVGLQVEEGRTFLVYRLPFN